MSTLRHWVSVFSRCVNGHPWPTVAGELRSDFLVVQPSGCAGFGRLVDIGGVFDDYNVSGSVREADERALFYDMVIVGQDLNQVFESYDLNPDQMRLPFAPAATRDEEAQAAES